VDHLPARPAIKKLMVGGPLQLRLFDQQDLAERSAPQDFPGERLIACRNPVLAAERASKSSPGPGCVTTGDGEWRRAEPMPYSVIFSTGTRHGH
jgi:hypothetical protein